MGVDAVDVNDRHWLDLAARHALRAFGRAEPNPMVGCAIVRDGELIGLGHHRRFGDVHAERDAVLDAERRGRSVEGATAYVTLEPCSHVGKQPPCVDLLIDRRIARVVGARADVAKASRGGFDRLQAVGIECEFTDVSRLAGLVSEPFWRRIETGRPWLIGKWAQTLDGRLATRSGESQWISNAWSRSRVHRLRGRVDAIVTGIGTVLADDPLLTVRSARPARRTPMRAVIDPDADTPIGSRLVASVDVASIVVVCAESAPTGRIEALQAAGVTVERVETTPSGLDLVAAMQRLSALGVATAMTECGPGLLGGLLAAGVVEQATVYVAPTLMGDDAAIPVARGLPLERLSDATRLELLRTKRLDGDLELTYLLERRAEASA